MPQLFAPNSIPPPRSEETVSPRDRLKVWEIVRIRESTKFPSTPQPETRDSVRRVMVNVVGPANEVAVLGGIVLL